MEFTREAVFQDHIITHLVANGWEAGRAQDYDRKLALYRADVLKFVQTTQPKAWAKLGKQFPQDTEAHFFKYLEKQLSKVNQQGTQRELSRFGTLGVLRHGLNIRSVRFFLCAFKPDHDLNPQTLANYQQNICRVVPELTYSPYATEQTLAETGQKAKPFRIDLVLFVNGLPVVTMELKSEFKQSVADAIKQYKKTRLPVDPTTRKPEPLLTFKRGALVHFAVSQARVSMTTQLQGETTQFLPFNQGKKDGSAGNDVPDDPSCYPTQYLWAEVLQKDSLLHILACFMHLKSEIKTNAKGEAAKKETMLFPRYHQLDVVRRLLAATLNETKQHKYLIQHSAGSGKSNSIAWTAHQLAHLYDASQTKFFSSIIIVTDRTVLDQQLQDTIAQFDDDKGVVERIQHHVGQGSKSEKLAKALLHAKPIIVVTLQTFGHVMDAMTEHKKLLGKRYAVIADEAHSSQGGQTANKVKTTLEGDHADLDTDGLFLTLKEYANIYYYGFTATPKAETIELFGCRPDPNLPASSTNKPKAFHVYSMRQAIEEGFILDVLQNYTNYQVVYQLKQKLDAADHQVDEKKAAMQLTRWARLHPHNIGQKVQTIIEHFKQNVAHLLNGQAKAMVVTGSCKEAVRYKHAFDRYIQEQGYPNIQALVAFSGEVRFNANDPDSQELVGEAYTEKNMNPEIKNKSLPDAFNSDQYQVMLAAKKFQTGFDQPKLCAMYVDKKLSGVDCVQTLSRLNRMYHGKKESGTFVLDFCNDPEDILKAFQYYYEEAKLSDVTDPDQLYDLFEQLQASMYLSRDKVTDFAKIFHQTSKKQATLGNFLKPIADAWHRDAQTARDAKTQAEQALKAAKQTGDAIYCSQVQLQLDEAKQALASVESFKANLTSFGRLYGFLAQIYDGRDSDLENMDVFAKCLLPLLRDTANDHEDVDLTSVQMEAYRLSKQKQQQLILQETSPEYQLDPKAVVSNVKPKNAKEAYLSAVIEKLNQLFDGENLSNDDLLNYLQTVQDKVCENEHVMQQIQHNSPDQIMRGGFTDIVQTAIFDSAEVHEQQKMQLLQDRQKIHAFAELILKGLLALKDK
jgi:type I restriction enzyme R subunit